MNREETDRAIAYFHERFDTIGIWENYPIPGMRELLAELCEKGYKLALASSKPKHAATDICEKFGFAPYLSVIGGNDEDLGARAKWEIIQQVMEFFGVSDKSEVLMVGDRKYGVEDPECEIALWSYRLAFKHPYSGKPMEFLLDPPDAYPWSIC